MSKAKLACYSVLLAVLGLTTVSGVDAQARDQVELDGVIEPSEVTEISGGVLTGILERILVERGDFVRKGQLLAVIDSRLERANLELAKARVESTAALEAAEDARDYYAAAYERAQRLFETQILSAEDRDQAEQEAMLAENRWRTEVDTQMLARIELQRAEVALEMRRLVSPIAGVVTERDISAGEAVGQAPLLTVAQLDPLHVEVVAPASLYGVIEVGMTGRVVLGPPISGTYAARVVMVDRVLDAASNTLGIRLELPNPDYTLPAGVRGTVRFTVDRPS